MHRSIIPISLMTVVVSLLIYSPQTIAGPEVLGDLEAASQGWAMIEEGALLIDVRSAEEFTAGHIEGAVNIPHSDVDRLAALIGEDKGRATVVYCRSGGRAGQAQTALAERGYTHVFNASGLQALEASRASD